jgi:hypothetical protein
MASAIASRRKAAVAALIPADDFRDTLHEPVPAT